MQEYKQDELVATEQGKSLQELINQLQPDSTHVVMGVLPNRGELVKINGLVFVVLSKSDREGTLNLEIVKPKKSE
jgi:hypothetical protein